MSEIFDSLFVEFNGLRNCGFSRKGLVQLMEMKNEKKQA